MNLYDLMDSTTIQGDVRLSLFNDGEEIAVAEFKCCDGLCSHDLYQFGNTFTVDGDDVEVSEWEWCEVKYLFCPGDGFLHIEVEVDDETLDNSTRRV